MAGYLGAALMGLASGMSAYDEKQKKDAQAKQQQDLENQRIAALTKSTNQQTEVQKWEWDQKINSAVQKKKDEDIIAGRNIPANPDLTPEQRNLIKIGQAVDQQPKDDPKGFSGSPILATAKAQVRGETVSPKTQGQAGKLLAGSYEYYMNNVERLRSFGGSQESIDAEMKKADTAAELATKHTKESLENRKLEIEEASEIMDGVNIKKPETYKAALIALKQTPGLYEHVTQGFDVTGDPAKDANFIEAMKKRVGDYAKREHVEHEKGMLKATLDKDYRDGRREDEKFKLIKDQETEVSNFQTNELLRAEAAKKAGVPFEPMPAEFIGAKAKDKLIWTQHQDNKYLPIYEKSMQAVKADEGIKQALTQFMGLAKKYQTGPTQFDLRRFTNSEDQKTAYATMDKISSLVTLAVQNGMHSARTSVALQKLEQQGTVNKQVPFGTNMQITRAYGAVIQADEEELQAKMEFKKVNPHGNPAQLEMELENYNVKNPILIVDPQTNRLVANEHRVPYLEYMKKQNEAQ